MCSTTQWKLTFKVEISAFGILVTLSIVLQTATDGQQFDLTCYSISNVVVLTAALLLSLNIGCQRNGQAHSMLFNCVIPDLFCPHRCCHGADCVLMAATIVPSGTGVYRLAEVTVAWMSSWTGTAHLISLLRALGCFCTTTIPEMTHVYNCCVGDSEKKYSSFKTFRPMLSFFFWRFTSALPKPLAP